MGYETINGRVVRAGKSQSAPKPRLNRYTCQDCAGHIITVDVDPGTAPFMIVCRATRGCDGSMYSSFYTEVSGMPTYEWRKPTPDEYFAMSQAMREHIDMGGLYIYRLPEGKSGDRNG